MTEDQTTKNTTVADYLTKYLDEVYNPEHVDFKLLSTIRYDPNLSDVPPITSDEVTKDNFFLFDEHFHRLLFTLKYFRIQMNETGRSDELEEFEVSQDFILDCLRESLRNTELPLFKPMKIRWLVTLKGDLIIELYETPFIKHLLDAAYDKVEINQLVKWDVRVDTERSLISPFTSFKTTNRKVYSDARERGIPGNKPGLEEVLLINSQGHVMEGSITNVAVKRKSDNRWITPLLSSGCLCGVTRNYLLRQKIIEEDVVELKDVPVGTELLLFNGIVGVVRGEIVA